MSSAAAQAHNGNAATPTTGAQNGPGEKPPREEHHEAHDASNVSSRGPFKEPVNSVTHLIGAVLALVATVLLLLVSDGSPRAIVSLAIFGISSVVLFTSSTLLHAVRAGPNVERWLRRLDHAAIFVLIAGSYTPIALIAMQPDFSGWGWTLFGVVWGIAIAGLVFKLLWIGAPRWLSTALYLAMGWLVVIAIVPVARSLGLTNMTWLIIGGLFYTVGAVIYALKKPNLWPGVLGFHELWHLFVLAGWGSHLVIVFRLATLSN